jgi:hypothetical protein
VYRAQDSGAREPTAAAAAAARRAAPAQGHHGYAARGMPGAGRSPSDTVTVGTMMARGRVLSLTKSEHRGTATAVLPVSLSLESESLENLKSSESV